MIDEWADHDEVEEALIRGGKPAMMHQELREALCDHEEYSQCANMDEKIEVRPEQGDHLKGEQLGWKGVYEQCSAEGGGKKKKKKAKSKR